MRAARMILALGLGALALACRREQESARTADSVTDGVTDSVIDRGRLPMAAVYESVATRPMEASSAEGATTAAVPAAATPGATDRAGRSGPGAAGREVILAVHEEVPGLLNQARFLPIDAQHLALTKFPAGAVRGAEIRRQGGNLVFSYLIQRPGVAGMEEVLVDAREGALLGSTHRDAAQARRLLAGRQDR